MKTNPKLLTLSGGAMMDDHMKIMSPEMRTCMQAMYERWKTS